MATGNELVRFANAQRSSLMVAYHGVDQRIFRVPDAQQIQRVRDSLELGDQCWIAFLGTLEPRKNVPALVRAFIRAVGPRSEQPALVLAGSAGWDSAIEPAVAAVPTGLRVIRTGHLPIDDLPGLLGGAQIVAYPSLGEGFGLPVLEAMACGAAVLTTRKLSLPEVGGDAVAYTGTGAGDIAAGISDLLDDPERRAELSAAAVERAAGFTWAASAEAHHDAYVRAAAEAKE
jgi:glycosyltransferase involved in cell wall biosynthesis